MPAKNKIEQSALDKKNKTHVIGILRECSSKCRCEVLQKSMVPCVAKCEARVKSMVVVMQFQ